jgi:hypothetical protein
MQPWKDFKVENALACRNGDSLTTKNKSLLTSTAGGRRHDEGHQQDLAREHPSWDQCYKTFYFNNLLMFVIS